MTKEQLAEMKQKLYALEDGTREARYAYDRLRREKLAVATKAIDLEMETAPVTLQLRDLNLKVAEAKSELIRAEDEAALQATNAPYPIGTRMAKWNRYQNVHYDSTGNRMTTVRYKLTEERGVLEVVTSSTVHPGNRAYWNKASIGRFIIRLLRKNGLPGKEYVGFDRNGLWRPEGFDLEAHFNAELIAKEQAEKQAVEDAEKAKANAALAALYGDK